MKGMFFNGQYMKLFNSYFYYHLNLDFVLDGNVSQKNKNKWRTFKKKKMIKIIRVPSRAIRWLRIFSSCIWTTSHQSGEFKISRIRL